MSFSIHIVCELRFSVCEKASERLFRALADIEIICVGIDIALEQERALLRIVYRFNEFVVPFGVVDRRDKLVLCAYAALFELLRRLNDSRALGKVSLTVSGAGAGLRRSISEHEQRLSARTKISKAAIYFLKFFIFCTSVFRTR